MTVRAPERAGRGGTVEHKRWALWPYKQFDLVRTDDGGTYLTRWWLFATPWGGVALHKMCGPDARATVHDHPFPFVSVVLRGGYVEDRLDPKTMTVARHVVRRVNRMPMRAAHTVTRLLAVPTWTLVFVGRHSATWGFLEEYVLRDGTTYWRWMRHDRVDSGHYVP